VQEQHDSILHQGREQVANAVDTVSDHALLPNKSVLLSTDIVLIENISNQFMESRAFLYAGSPSSFISGVFESYVLHEWCVHDRLFNAYYEVKLKKKKHPTSQHMATT
jgi:hypothetical protein